MTPEDRFDALVADLTRIDGVSPPAGGRRFGAQALRRGGRIFAMLAGGRLVVKLPRQRVDELVAAGAGVRFDANKATPMKEWFVLGDASGLGWDALAREALAFAETRDPSPASARHQNRNERRNGDRRQN
jgi:hypothetical protein